MAADDLATKDILLVKQNPKPYRPRISMNMWSLFYKQKLASPASRLGMDK